MLTGRDRSEAKQELQSLAGRVRLINFTQELGCQYCRETERLLKDVAELSELVDLTVFNLQIDKAEAAAYRVDRVPATVVAGEQDHGIRFYGIPSGYEFASLLEAMRDVARGSADFAPGSRAALAGLADPIHLQVFVTPT